VTSRASYESVARWRRDLLDACGANLQIMLVGNKAAAADGERKVRHVYCAAAPPQTEAATVVNDEKVEPELAADVGGTPAPPSAAELAAVRALPFFEVSTRENRSMTRSRSLIHPLLHLTRKLVRLADLEFMPVPRPAGRCGRRRQRRRRRGGWSLCGLVKRLHISV